MNSSRNKVLLAIIVFLLLANIGMLVFIFKTSRPSEPQKGPGFTERLRKEVGFSEDQMKVFEPRKKAFWNSMRDRFEKMKNTKENFYFQLYDASIPDSILVIRAEAIGDQQRDMDLFVIRHFKDTRKLCTEQQLVKFDSLLPSIIHRMTEIPGKR